MALDPKDLQQLAAAIVSGIERSAGSLKSSVADNSAAARAVKSTKKLADATDELTAATQELAESSNKQLKSSSRGTRALDKFNTALEQSSQLIEDNLNAYYPLVGKSLQEQSAMFADMSKKSKDLSSQLAQTQKNSSLLSAAFISTHSEIREGTTQYKSYITNLGKSLGSLDRGYLKAAGLLDEATSELRDNLRADDFARLRAQLGAAQSVITETISKLGVDDLGALVKNKDALKARLTAPASEGAASSDKFKSALIVLAAQLEKQGHATGVRLLDESGGMSAGAVARMKRSGDFEKLAMNIAKISDSINTAGTSLTQVGQAANSTAETLKKTFSRQELYDKYIAPLSTSAGIMGNLNRAADNAKKSLADIASFNMAQVPASFANVNYQAVQLGMGFADTVRYLQENKRALALLGPKEFTDLNSNLSDTFKKFNITMKEGAQLVGPTLETAVSAGIDVGTREKMNEAVEQSVRSFKAMSATTNITAENFVRLRQSLISNADMQLTMLGLGKESAAQYLKDTDATRQHFTVMGLSAEAANDLLKTTQAQQRERVTERIRSAAMGSFMLQQFGASPEQAARFQELTRKGSKTVAEQAELADLSAKLATARETAREAAYGQSEAAGMAIDVMTERANLSGASGSLVQQGVQMEMARRAGQNLTAEQEKRAQAEAQGSQAVTTATNAFNSINSVIQNSFVGAITSTALSFYGLTAQSIMLGRAMSGAAAAAAGAGGVGIPGGSGPAGGAGGKFGGKLVRGVGLAAVGGIASNLVLGSMQSSAEAAGNTKTASGLDILSDATSGALMGATIGSIIPGVGTAIGAATGGLIAGGYGLVKNWGKLTAPAAGSVIVPAENMLTQAGSAGSVNTASQSSSVVRVNDETAASQLAAIAQNMQAAVEILQKMASSNITLTANGAVKTDGPGSQLTSTVPTYTTYITGRV